MPIVHVKITPGATVVQKEQLIEGITNLLVSVLDKNPDSTHVLIEEIPIENWGIKGKSVAALRASGAAGISKK